MGQKSSRQSKSKVESQSTAQARSRGFARRNVPGETTPQVIRNSDPELEDATDRWRFQSGAHILESGHPRYRPLDRSQNEIRLLRILPPTKSTWSSQDLETDQEIVQCQLEYASLDCIDETNKEVSAAEAANSRVLDFLFDGMPGNQNDARAMAAVKRAMLEDLSHIKTEDGPNPYPVGPKRKQILRDRYGQFDVRREELLPSAFRRWTSSSSWESWLRSWVYTPLSGDENSPEKPNDGYFALSYVWSDSHPEVYRDTELNHITKLAQAGGGSVAKMFDKAGLPPGLPGYEINAHFKSQIILDGHLVEVSQNLEKALKTIREIPEVKLGKRIWADSLCINQKDIEEKSYEVKRMGQIYASAERVVSWIGDEQDFSGEALEIMSIIGECLITEEEMARFGEWFFENLQSEFVFRIAQVVSRSYWSRIWIVQEIVLGNEKGITICGARRFPTSQILKFGTRIMSSCPEIYLNSEYMLGQKSEMKTRSIPIYFLASGLGKLRDLRQTQVNLPVLTELQGGTSTLWFRTASGNYASDPRDLLYGMLNLLPKQLTEILPVSYSPQYTFQKTMVDLATANIKITQSLSWILHRPWSRFPGWEEWPSWVPNIALPFSTAHFWWNLGTDACSGNENRVNFKIHTTGHTHVLLCDGLLVDTINQATLSQASKRSQEHRQLMAAPQIADEVAHLAGLDPYNFRKLNRRIGGNSLPEPPQIPNLNIPSSSYHRYGDMARLKSALAECFQRLNVVPKIAGESLFNLPLGHLENESGDLLSEVSIEHTPTFNTSSALIQRHIFTAYGDLDLWGISFKSLFQQQATERPPPELAISDRTFFLGRLFTTASGFVGAALCHLRPGDQVYIIPGCPMPVALRPSASSPSAYELLGGVYVPGIMNGEMFQHLDAIESTRNSFSSIALI